MINRVIGLLLLVFFLFLFSLIPSQISDKGVPPNSPLPIYPQFFPKILAIFGCLLSLSLFVKSFFKSKVSDGDIEIPTKGNIFRIIWVIVIICIYLLTFDLLGYLISTSLSLILFMLFFGLRDYKYFALIILTVPPIIYYLFKKLLYVPFPVGLLGF